MNASHFKSQMETLLVLRLFHREHGYSPTYQELADLRGMSQHAVHTHVNQLIGRGYIKQGTPGAWRQIYLTEAA